MTDNASAAETVTKTTKKKAPKKPAKAKGATPTTKARKAAKPEVEKPPRESREGWGTFALRLPVEERESFHKAAGPAGASRVARSLLAAFVSEDRAVFESIIEDAKKLR